MTYPEVIAYNRDQQQGLWRLGELSGTFVSPALGPCGGAYVGNPTWGAGLTGDLSPAVHFDGTDRAVISRNTDWESAAVVTAECWINQDAVQLVALPRLMDRANGNLGWRLFSSQTVPLTINFSVFFQLNELRSANVLTAATDSQVNHIVGTYDGRFNRIFVNGLLIGEQDHTTYAPIAQGVAGLILGDRQEGDRGYVGSMSNAAVYGRVLAIDEIQKHYVFGKAPSRVTRLFSNALLVTPSDTVDGPFPNANQPFGHFRGLWVITAGDVVVVQPNDVPITFTGVPAGTFLPVTGRRVNATGTTPGISVGAFSGLVRT